MDTKFESLLSVAIIPQTVALIADKEKLDDIAALKAFYDSQTYEFLSKEETKVWHFSPLTIYNMWKSEEETGTVMFPED